MLQFVVYIVHEMIQKADPGISALWASCSVTRKTVRQELGNSIVNWVIAFDFASSGGS
jgi:hypothetical protein